MSPGAAIIIVTFNSSTTIEACLASVLVTLRPVDEVFVIDNNSSDNTLDLVHPLVSANDNRVHVLPQSRNLGFSRGCNIGIENSDQEYVILLNPDTEVFGDWIERLINHFSEHDKTGAVGALSNRALRSQQIRSYLPDYLDYLTDVDGLLVALEKKFHRKSIPTRLLMGFCLALRRDLIERFGPLDEDIFLGDDDLEISWRLREKGYLLRIALDVFLNHEDHVSFDTLPESQANALLRQGTDVLFAKMQKYYKPARVPDPRIYFAIHWWRPSILDKKPYHEVFDPDVLPCPIDEILPTVRRHLKAAAIDRAVTIMEKSLEFLPNDYMLWYTLGSVYLLMEKLDKAEFALKNASCFEDKKVQARTKLLELYKRQHRLDEARRFLGEFCG
ncbi:MAG: glycosyltransferase [bacterium]